MRHVNNGQCLKCLSIINLYQGLHEDLRSWFVMMQANHPEMHVSEAGRGKERQEEMFKEGKSRAHWGESAHNYNCAIDVFCILEGTSDIYDQNWFYGVLLPEIPSYLEWYGQPDAPFFELPHLQVKNWQDLKIAGKIELVDKMRGIH